MNLVTTDFNGAHWRVIVAGEVAGYFGQEQQAQESAALTAAALETEIAMRVSEAFYAERNRFLDVVAQLHIATRAALQAFDTLALTATTDQIRNVIEPAATALRNALEGRRA